MDCNLTFVGDIPENHIIAELGYDQFIWTFDEIQWILDESDITYYNWSNVNEFA